MRTPHEMTSDDIVKHNSIVSDYEQSSGLLPREGQFIHLATYTHAFRGRVLEVSSAFFLLDPTSAPVALVESTGAYGKYMECPTQARKEDVAEPGDSVAHQWVNRGAVSWMLSWERDPYLSYQGSIPRSSLDSIVLDARVDEYGRLPKRGDRVHIATVTHAFGGTLLDVTPSFFRLDPRCRQSLVESTGAYGKHLVRPNEGRPADMCDPGNNPHGAMVWVSRGAISWMDSWTPKQAAAWKEASK